MTTLSPEDIIPSSIGRPRLPLLHPTPAPVFSIAAEAQRLASSPASAHPVATFASFASFALLASTSTSASPSLSSPSTIDLTCLPIKAITHMLSYLTVPDVRLLSLVDRVLRYALLRCAYVGVWLERMADIFPSGFLEMIDDIGGGGLGGGRARRQERITLVDYHRIPVPAASTIGPAKREKNNGDGDDCDSDEDARLDDIANVNLPLLAGLMPARYPQRIDERTPMSTTKGN